MAGRTGENGTIADGSTIMWPSSVPARTYLHRMDAIRVLFEHVANDPPDPVVRHEVSGLKECEHFASEKGGQRVAAPLSKAIQDEVDTDRATEAALDVCLTELAENVYFHADAAAGGFAAAQRFKNTQELEIAIVDLGRGIAASLAGNPEYAEEAARPILLAAVTRRKVPA